MARISTALKSASAVEQLRAFIAKFTPADQVRIRAARAWIRRRLPTAFELVYDNYNFFVIGYGPSARPSDAVLSLAAGANGLSLCFLHGARLPDPSALLQGSGNQTRFLRLPAVATLDQAAVRALIDAAIAHGKPFAASGGGELVIRSVSAKQRPRRREVVAASASTRVAVRRAARTS
jgi:hypothetical protein